MKSSFQCGRVGDRCSKPSDRGRSQLTASIGTIWDGHSSTETHCSQCVAEKLDNRFEDPRFYLFANNGLREAAKAHDFGRVLKALDEAGAFVKKGSKQKSFTTRTSTGSTTPLYWINPEKLQSDL